MAIEILGKGNSSEVKEMYDSLYENYLGYVLIRDYNGELVEYFKLSEDGTEEYTYFTSYNIDRDNDVEDFIIKGEVEEMLEFVSEKTGFDYEELMYSFIESEY